MTTPASVAGETGAGAALPAPIPAAADGATGGAAVTTLAAAATGAFAPRSLRAAAPMAEPETVPAGAAATLSTLAEASPADIADIAAITPADGFATPLALPDGSLATGAAFDQLPARDGDLLVLTAATVGGGTAGGGGGGGGIGGIGGIVPGTAASADPIAIGATGQIQLVSGVPEPASWITFILGLGLVGANIRKSPRLRSVSS